MENKKRLSAVTIILTVAIVGIVLWKYAGVAKEGDKVLPSNNKTTEEKMLNSAISEIGQISEGQMVTTNFGEYQYRNGEWVKTKEIFNVLTL